MVEPGQIRFDFAGPDGGGRRRGSTNNRHRHQLFRLPPNGDLHGLLLVVGVTAGLLLLLLVVGGGAVTDDLAGVVDLARAHVLGLTLPRPVRVALN